MNLALLLLLALLWAVVLLPSAVRNHRHSLHHSMGGFERTMQVLGAERGSRPDTRRVLVPADAARIVSPPRGAELARERRRRTLVRLALAAGVLTSLALVFGGVFVLPALLADGALVAFVAALRNLKVRAQRERELVRLGDHRRVAEPVGWTERRAVNG